MDMETLRNLSSQATERLHDKAEHIEGGPTSAPAPKAEPDPAPAPKEAPAKTESDPEPKEAEPAKLEEEIPTPSPGKPNAAAAAVLAAAAAVIPADAEAPPAYKPNYKYKIGDESREIPEQLRAVIKDPASENFVRDLITKADGLPIVKEQNQALKLGYQELHENHTTLNAGLADLGQHIKKKDFGTFFDTLKVDRRDVYAWVLQEAEKEKALSELPPAQRAYIQTQEQQAREAADYQRIAQQQNSQFQEQAQRTRRLEVQLAVSQPDVQTVATAFNTRAGNPDAFMKEVAAAGKEAWDTEGRDLTAHEAVQRAVTKWKPWLGEAPAMGAPAPEVVASTGAAPAATAARKSPPVLPTVPGGTTSPTRAAPKNLADLKKLASEASARLSQRG